MLQHGVIKISSAKLLGFVAVPGVALAGISGYLAWKLWDTNRQSDNIEHTVDETKPDQVHPSTDPRDDIFRQIMDENIALRTVA